MDYSVEHKLRPLREGESAGRVVDINGIPRSRRVDLGAFVSDESDSKDTSTMLRNITCPRRGGFRLREFRLHVRNSDRWKDFSLVSCLFAFFLNAAEVQLATGHRLECAAPLARAMAAA